MKRNLYFIIIMLALSTMACNSIIKLPISNLKTIPLETFSIDEPLPMDEEITKVSFSMAASTATLKIAGEADGLIQGQVQYNIAEWEPSLTAGNNLLLIEQDLPTVHIRSLPDESINEWDIKLGDELQNVHIKCPAGDFTLYFLDTLPDSTSFNIEMGNGNLRLVVPTEAAASVDVNQGSVSVSTEGTWISNGNSYAIGDSTPTWLINVEMGAGTLTLASE